MGIILNIDGTVIENIGYHFAESTGRTGINVGLVVLKTDTKKCLTFFTTYFIVILSFDSTSTTISDGVTT